MPLATGNLSLESCLQPWLFGPVFQSPCCHAAFLFLTTQISLLYKELVTTDDQNIYYMHFTLKTNCCLPTALHQMQENNNYIPLCEIILEVCSSSPTCALQCVARFLLFFCSEGQKDCIKKEWAESCQTVQQWKQCLSVFPSPPAGSICSHSEEDH